jgi:hypothetical protein
MTPKNQASLDGSERVLHLHSKAHPGLTKEGMVEEGDSNAICKFSSPLTTPPNLTALQQ